MTAISIATLKSSRSALVAGNQRQQVTSIARTSSAEFASAHELHKLIHLPYSGDSGHGRVKSQRNGIYTCSFYASRCSYSLLVWNRIRRRRSVPATAARTTYVTQTQLVPDLMNWTKMKVS